MVKFIHAADLHLDSPFKGLKNSPQNVLKKIKEATFKALQNIVNEAIKHQVDFVLFAGDIYDIEDRSVKAQVLFQQEMGRLKERNIAVFLIHGNHDYQANKEDHLSLPSNVFVFPSTVTTIDHETAGGEIVTVSGFSYNKKWINERKIANYPQRRSQTTYHIGLLHGYSEGQDSDHARYAPFTIRELREKNYDYWALGHIHKREQLSQEPLAFYSGNPQGRHKKETGEKGCLLVDLSPASSNVTFLPTADIRWKKIRVDVTALQSLDAIFEAIKESLKKEREVSSLIDLEVIISNSLSPAVMNKLEQQDFYDALQLYTKESFVYIVDAKIKIELKENQVISLKNVFPTAWTHALEEIQLEEQFEQETDELYRLHAYAKYLGTRNRGFRQDMLDRATHLLLQDLGDEEGENNDY